MTTPTTVKCYGSYLAKQCPHRVARDHDPNYTPDLATPVSPAQQARMDAGVRFEEAIKHLLLVQHPTMVCIPNMLSESDPAGVPNSEREQLTAEAMSDGVELIWNARIPADVDGRRVGEPDLLIRGPKKRNGKWSYRPIDVKWHRPRATKGTQTAHVSSLDAPHYAKAHKVTGVGATRLDDALQLAHYARMLTACGHGQPKKDTIGGIIGRDGHVWWVKLSDPFRSLNHPEQGVVKVNLLELYDHKFELRVDIADRAATRQPDDPHVVELCTNWSVCRLTCPWREVGHRELLAADALTLLTGVTQKSVNKLAAVGITTRAELASVEDTTIGELETITGVKNLEWHVHSARAVVQGAVLPRPTFEWFPTHGHSDGWIDVDMENDPDTGIVYMWGVRTVNGYQAFVDWSGSDEGEKDTFVKFWAWLHNELDTAPHAVAYCYTSAEERCLKHLARKHAGEEGVPTVEQVEEFVASARWADLHKFVKNLAWPTESLSVKEVAKVAGFTWRDASPSGEESVLWYREARDANSRARARRNAAIARLLAYNEDDVKAMEAIRTFVMGTVTP